MRRALVLAVVALGAALAAPGADAHYNTARLGYRSRVIAITPRIPGVTAKVLYGDDQVLLDNRSGKTITIIGYSGEPYLRLGANGIYVNNNSPSLYLNADRYGKSTVPKFATAGARPDWHRLISGHVWAWHDHRIHWMSPIPPKTIKDAPRKRHHLYDWKVTAKANGKQFYITGSLDYVPPPKQSFPVNLAIALGTLIALGTAGLFALRRVILRSLD